LGLAPPMSAHPLTTDTCDCLAAFVRDPATTQDTATSAAPGDRRSMPMSSSIAPNHIRHSDHVRLQTVRRRRHGGHVKQRPPRHGGCRGWVDGASPANQAERPSRIPCSISSLRVGLPGGAVSRQLHLRPLNEYGALPIGVGSALTGAAPPTQEPRATAAPTNKFWIPRWRTLVEPQKDCDISDPAGAAGLWTGTHAVLIVRDRHSCPVVSGLVLSSNAMFSSSVAGNGAGLVRLIPIR
jgi:hypothetical protein